MSLRRSFVVTLVLLAFSSFACGGDPPDKEIQQAQNAIDQARAAGADRYAVEEYTAAVDALKNAHAAVDQRDYRLALNDALDSKERAENAAKLAVDGKAAARSAAEKALTAANAAVTAADTKVKAAVTAHLAARDAGRRPRCARRGSNARARSAHGDHGWGLLRGVECCVCGDAVSQGCNRQARGTDRFHTSSPIRNPIEKFATRISPLRSADFARVSDGCLTPI